MARAESGPPRSAKRVRTPLLLQLEDTGCGAARLGIVLAHFGRWVSIEELRHACAVSREGCDVADISRAARTYGLVASGWSKQPRHFVGDADAADPVLGFLALHRAGGLPPRAR